MAFQLDFQDTFNRGTTVVATSGGSITGVGNGWLETIAYNRFSINASNQLVIGGGGYATGQIYRSGENAQDLQYIVEIPITMTGKDIRVMLRRFDASNYYMATFAPSSGIQIDQVAAGAFTTPGALVALSPAYDSTHTYRMTCSAVGVSSTTITITVRDLTTAADVATLTVSTGLNTAAMQASLPHGLTSQNGITLTKVQILPAATTSANPDVFTLPASTAGQVVNLVGSGGAWGGGTTFSLTGAAATGSSITAQSVGSGTTAQLTITTGSTPGILTVTNNTDGSVAKLLVLAAAVVVAINDSNLVFSPYNWRQSGSTYQESINPGSYMRASFTCGGEGQVALGVAVTAGLTAGNYPQIAWSLDGATFRTIQLVTGQTTQSLGAVQAGSHTLVVYFKEHGTAAVGELWGASAYFVRITGLTLPAGSAQGAIAAAPRRTNDLIVFGDSITRATNVLTSGTGDAWFAYGMRLGEGLDAEVGIVGFGSQSWCRTGEGNAVKFHTPGDDTNTSWNKYSSGNSRLVSGALSPVPDYAVIMHGTNDGINGTANATVTASIDSFLPAFRTAAGAACEVFLVHPPGRYKTTAINAATLPDSKVHRVDLGTDLAVGLGNNPVAGDATAGFTPTVSRRSTDGTHPDRAGQAELAARLLAAMDAVILAGSGGGGVRRLALTGGITG